MIGRRRLAAILIGLCGLLALSGCIGAVDRHDFDRMVAGRGGGLVSSLPREAIAAMRARLGVPDFNVVDISLNASGQRADFRVRQPARPDLQDSYSYAQGRLGPPLPVRLSAAFTHDESFPISQLAAFDRVEELVDTALAKTGFESGQVTTITAELASGDIQVAAQVESPRSEATVLFDKTGAFLGMRLR